MKKGICLLLCVLFTCMASCDPPPEQIQCSYHDDCGSCAQCCNGRCQAIIGSCCKPGDFKECGSDIGECQSGERRCKDDKTWGECQGEVAPIMEEYDGLDNDCDGVIDDNVPDIGTDCLVGAGICQAPEVSVCTSDLG